MPLDGNAKGIDVSAYQGNVDWGSIKAAGISFAFAKASEGTGFTDPTFQQNWAGMQAAGVIRGAYLFFHPRFDPVEQAQLFARCVSLGPNDLPPALDVEVDDRMGPAAIVLNTQRCLVELERLTSRKPIIYTGGWFWTPLLRQFGSVPGWVANYDVWIADYSGGGQPVMPLGFNNWRFWQYSAKGRFAGIGGDIDVDVDVFNGTVNDLLALTGQGRAQPQPQPVIQPEPITKPLPEPQPAPPFSAAIENGKTVLQGSNQDIVNLFSEVFGTAFWDKIQTAGLTAIAIPPSNRNLLYNGPAIEDMPGLSDQDKLQLQSVALGAQG